MGELKEINDKDRPTCSCGEKMQLKDYQGYYDDFKYWECDNEDCDLNVDNLEADDKLMGSYA